MADKAPQNTLEQKVEQGIDNYAKKSRFNRALTVIGCVIVGGLLLLAGMPDKAEESFDKAKEVSTITIVNNATPPVTEVTPTTPDLLPAPAAE